MAVAVGDEAAVAADLRNPSGLLGSTTGKWHAGAPRRPGLQVPDEDVGERSVQQLLLIPVRIRRIEILPVREADVAAAGADHRKVRDDEGRGRAIRVRADEDRLSVIEIAHVHAARQVGRQGRRRSVQRVVEHREGDAAAVRADRWIESVRSDDLGAVRLHACPFGGAGGHVVHEHVQVEVIGVARREIARKSGECDVAAIGADRGRDVMDAEFRFGACRRHARPCGRLRLQVANEDVHPVSDQVAQRIEHAVGIAGHEIACHADKRDKAPVGADDGLPRLPIALPAGGIDADEGRDAGQAIADEDVLEAVEITGHQIRGRARKNDKPIVGADVGRSRARQVGFVQEALGAPGDAARRDRNEFDGRARLAAQTGLKHRQHEPGEKEAKGAA